MEPLIYQREGKAGWIEVICGSMFSGKTEELIRRLKRARIARQKVEIFKPAFDNRYSEGEVVSHDENVIPSTPVDTATQILLLGGDADVIGIDEAQFFDRELVEICQRLARDGKRVIVVGLDQDYLGQPFEPMPQLMAVAEYVTKLHAVCMVCGAPANHSQRIVEDGQRVLLGAKDVYEPRCRRHFAPQTLVEKVVLSHQSSQEEKSTAPSARIRRIVRSEENPRLPEEPDDDEHISREADGK